MQGCDSVRGASRRELALRRNRCHQIVLIYVSVYRTIYSYKHEGMIMQIEKISGSSCETLFNVNGEIIRLYIIIGGTPALAFEDHSFSQVYPVKDTRWRTSEFVSVPNPTNNHKKPRYVFQGLDTPDDEIQGPEMDVLPEGEATVIQFLEHYVPLRNLRRNRYESLPCKGNLRSKRFHNKEEKYYYYLTLEISQSLLSSITMTSGYSFGQITYFEEGQEWWAEYASVLRDITVAVGRFPRYEELTNAQFETYHQVLSRFPQ